MASLKKRKVEVMYTCVTASCSHFQKPIKIVLDADAAMGYLLAEHRCEACGGRECFYGFGGH